MTQNILFEEVQVFERETVRKFFFGANLLLMIGSVTSFFLQGSENISLAIVLLSGAIICAIITSLIKMAALVMQVSEEGILVKFPPFRNSFMIYTWENIGKLYIREYNPVMEYGGWGMKMSPNGTAFTVSGNVGLQIELVNGSKILIGTKQQDLLATRLLQIGKLDY